MVQVGFRVPEQWRERLNELAREQAISAADLNRMILRRYLYERPRDAA